MKLYYARGTCSLSPDIALREAGLPVELVKVDLRTKKTEAGDDYLAVNSKGYVPAIELDDGQRLTEGPVILQYVADKAPSSGLAPAAGTLERYRLQEWLNFLTTELHKQYSPLFNAQVDDAHKERQREKVEGRLAWVSQQLGNREYLMGSKFSVVDAYLFTIMGWSKHVGIELSKWPNLASYMERVSARPKVQEALRAEGMLK